MLYRVSTTNAYLTRIHIARTEDDIKREVARTRYDIVWEDLLKLRDILEDYIFDK